MNELLEMLNTTRELIHDLQQHRKYERHARTIERYQAIDCAFYRAASECEFRHTELRNFYKRDVYAIALKLWILENWTVERVCRVLNLDYFDFKAEAKNALAHVQYYLEQI